MMGHVKQCAKWSYDHLCLGYNSLGPIEFDESVFSSFEKIKDSLYFLFEPNDGDNDPSSRVWWTFLVY